MANKVTGKNKLFSVGITNVISYIVIFLSKGLI